ncbi:filamentous hemagglutinin N-terminal domain-containing protein [Pandoraea fibrosis]|uniref:Filamentous hemagglutinin N-terminal domain-containing protein n=1 Tax=Pandoraea fibrosis TaxID=1891094 RepID=A0ABX6HNS3_9BURK|nr:hemagglutinin repeat-containing protein [Pandoraea fibrosis]QHE94247.1 filamentous hemagglutinin N-terminal domain-containing protein [Pandoraea fibrosis]QHF12189.1 filamentous hemagglutinin N-terminal domain-containing protein [Pandoraea fibrosis]
MEIGLQHGLVRALVLAQIIAPISVRAQVVAAPGGPTVVQTANGLQQVNITTPTAAGVSKNVYSQFDVPRQGVILNNSPTIVNTQQAGYVNGNPNLARDQAARVILNQVNSNSPSQLRGYLEVAGKAAQVVVANSAGIMVDGGGFINTTRAVLTTGIPIMGADGSLAGYQVNGGRLVIQGDGLNAANVDQVDLIARAVQVNAALHAKQLNVVTGTNRVDHETLAVQKTTGDGVAPDVAVDVGQLGGMYAQRIFLVGTENGVGVSNKGVIAAQAGDLTLTTEGKLVTTGRTEATGNVSLNARAGIDNQGSVYAGGFADVRTGGILGNSGVLSAAGNLIAQAAGLTSGGTLGAGIDADGQATLVGSLTVTASGKVVATGRNVARGDMTVVADTLDLSGSRTDASQSLSLTSQAGDIDLQRAIVTASNALRVKAAQGLLNANGALSADTITLAALGRIDNNDAQTAARTRLDVTGANLDNQRGLFQSGGLLKVRGATLNNTAGRVVSLGGDGTSIDIDGELRNATGVNGLDAPGGVIGTNGDLRLHAGSLINAAQLVAGTTMTLTSGQLDNTNGTLSSEQIDVSVDGVLTNRQGAISATTSTLRAGQLVNDHGLIDADTLSLTVLGDASNRSGEIKQYGDSAQTVKVGAVLDNTAGTVATKASGLTLNVGQLVNDQGKISHLGNDTLSVISTGDVTNMTGLLGSLGALRISAARIENTGGELSASDVVWLTATKNIVNRSGGVVYGGNSLRVVADTDIDNAAGSMQSGGAVKLDANGTLTNTSGRISANGAHDALTVTVGSLVNAAGQLTNAGDGDTTVTAARDVGNAGGTIGGNGRLSIDAATLSNLSGGKIIGGGDVLLGVVGLLDNSAGQLFGDTSLTVTPATARLTNSGGTIESRGDVSLQIASLDNGGGVIRSNRDVGVGGAMNGAGQMTAGRNLTLAAVGDYVNASANRLRADGILKLTSTGRFTNDGTLMAPGTLDVQAAQIINNVNGSINATTTQLSAAGLFSNSGSISGDTVRLKANYFFNGYGVLGNDVQINAVDIENNSASAIIGGAKRLALYASNSVSNYDGALLYSTGDIEIARDGTRDGQGLLANQMALLTNRSASIVADGNLDIAARVINNSRTSIVTQPGTPQSTTQGFSLYTAGLTGGDETMMHMSLTFPEWFWSGGRAPISSSLLENLARPLTVNIPKSQVTNVDLAAKTFSLTKPLEESYQDMTTQGQGACDDHGQCGSSTKTREVGKNPTQYFNSIVDNGDSYRIVFWPDWDPNTMIRPDQAISRGDLGIDQRDYNEITRIVTTTRTRDELISASPEAKLQAQGSIRINADGGAINNQSSTMTAGRDLIRRATGGSVDDVGITLQETVTQTQTSTFYWHQKSGGDSDQKTVAYPVTPLPPTTLASLPAIAVGNQSVQSSGRNIAVSSVDRSGNTVGSAGVTGGNATGTQLGNLSGAVVNRQTLGSSAQAIPGLTLPKNALFQLRSAPGQTYLVATDSRFTDYGKFISSDYMLTGLNLDPQTTQKRIGDGFYETQLVRDQITALTGKTLLAGYTNYLDEYTMLLNNGVTYGKQFGLSVGVGLSDAQMKQLTSDMVWLVSQDVTLPDGSVQSVLVPQVYLAQANTVDLTNTGALVSGGSVKLAATGDVKNSGQIVSDTATTILGDAIVNLGVIGSGGTTALSSLGDIRNTGGRIGGKDVVVQAGRDLINESTTLTQTAGTDTGGSFTSSASATGIGAVGIISGSNSATAVAARDVTLNAGAIASDGAVVVAAGRDINANTLTVGQSQTVGTTDGQNGGNDVIVQNVGSAISAGGNLTAVSGRDTTLSGTTVAASGNATVLAGNDVTVTAVKDSHSHDERSFGGSLQYAKSSLDEAVNGASVSAGNHVLIGAGQTSAVGGVLGAYQISPVAASSGTGNLSVLGSSVSSQGNGTVALAATGDVNIGTVTETHDSQKWQHDSSSGFLSKTEETSSSSSHQTIAVGSTASGNAVGVSAGRDLIVSGSTVVGTQDVALQAGRDVRIESAQNESQSSSFYEKKSSGLGSSGGVGISYGKNEQRDQTNDSSVTQTGSMVGSLNGNVSVVAGNDLLVRGSDIMAAGDITGIGQNVTIESALNQQHHDETHEFKSSGFTLAVKSPVIDAIQNVTNQVKAAVDSGGDARVSALRGYAAASGAVGAFGETKGALSMLEAGKTPEAKVELSFGSSSSRSTSSVDTTQNVSSNIRSGGTTAFVATGDAASGKGNVNIIGSNIDAKDVLLQATNQVNVLSSKDTESTRSDNESKGGSFGVSFGTSGWGVSASFSKSNGDANSDSTFQNNSHINASNTAVIVSGGDTNIVGGNVNADKVIARVGGDLNIASVQDTSESSAHQESMGGGFSASMGGASGSFSYSRGNASGNYAGVVEQSGIQAGSGGFDVDVKGNTDLKGSYIASTADPSKNQLTTGTLTFSDIRNHSDYSANSFGFGGGGTFGNGGANERTTGPSSGKNTGGISPMLPQSESGSERGVTRSGVSDGAITLTNGANQTQDLASLNRDTSNLNETVNRTPDLQNLLNDQSRLMAAATAAGEAVARDIGTYADKKREAAQKLADATTDPELKAQYQKEADDWKEGGDYRAAMHAAGGAIIAGLGGGNALGGALGAGLTSKLGGALNELSDNIQKAHPTGNADIDQALAQIVATGVGTAVGAAVGGSSGAFAAYNVDRFNRQLHSQESVVISKLASEKAEQVCQGDAACIGQATVYWTDVLERTARGLVDDAENEKNLVYLQRMMQAAGSTNSIGAQGGVAQYLASMKEAQDMLSSFMGQTILVKGSPVISDGSPQTYFSATGEQRANPYTNYLLGSQPPGSIILGMELRDQSRLTYLATPNGAAQPVYPLEEWLIGGKLVDTLIGTLGRLLSSTDIAILGRASASAGGNISAQQITRESTQLRLTSADRTLLSQLDTVSNTALQGDLREYVVNNYFVRNGFKSMEGKCGGSNCFDGVYIKGDTLYVVEVKPLRSNGSIKLSTESGNLPTQMSDGWIESAIDRLGRGSNDQRATAAAIRSAIEENRLVKIVAGVNSDGVTAVRLK